jgi:hypothetical protein
VGGPDTLLAIWEVGASVDPKERDCAMLSAQGRLVPSSLGERNGALFRLRSTLFGKLQQLRCNCPKCTAACDFSVDCDELERAAKPLPDAASAQRVSCEGYEVSFRVPLAEDVEAAEIAKGASFEDRLLKRCIMIEEGCAGPSCDVFGLPSRVLEAINNRMEELEPGASISFELACPECGYSWNAPMDVGKVLWSEVQAQAERLFLDIDALARAYGWSEESILALSPTRRAAYLQLVRAAA